MGFFDLFRNKDSAQGQTRELARLQKMTASKLSQDLDRQAALEKLAALGSSEAVKILLLRFNWTLDPSIRDQEEKSVALEGIVRAGDEALEPLRAFCKRAESISWPLKALRRIVPAERLEQELVALLNQFDTDYQRNPEPKVQLLQALEGFSSDELRTAVEPFLDDSSEAVRFAAVTALFGIDSSKSLKPLVGALANDESLRIRNRIAQGLVERSWEVPEDLSTTCSAALPRGFSLSGHHVIGATSV